MLLASTLPANNKISSVWLARQIGTRMTIEQLVEAMEVEVNRMNEAKYREALRVRGIVAMEASLNAGA